MRKMHRIVEEDLNRLLEERKDLGLLGHQSILIAGANSFLMSYLVYLLLENNRRNHSGTKIVALCRSRKNAEARFAPYLDDPDLSIITQDVRDPVAWEGDVDICVHAASPVGLSSRWEQSLETFQTNLYGCQNLLELAESKRSRRFLLLSSVDVYGDSPDRARKKEEDTGLLDWRNMRNAYSSGKRGAETLCGLYHAQRGVPCVTARPSQIYGPGISLSDGRLHGDFIRQLREKNQIVLKSDGTAVRSFMYLLDATDALLDVLLYGNAGESYNVCDEAGECSVKELAERYAAEWGNGAEVVFDLAERDTPEVKGALAAVTGDSGKLRGLGWASRTSLKDGIRRTLRVYTDNMR